MIFLSLISLVSIRVIYTTFEGVVIARLPFEPFSLISGLTHYGLPGENKHECSMTFIFILCNLTLGNYTKKALGLEG